MECTWGSRTFSGLLCAAGGPRFCACCCLGLVRCPFFPLPFPVLLLRRGIQWGCCKGLRGFMQSSCLNPGARLGTLWGYCDLRSLCFLWGHQWSELTGADSNPLKDRVSFFFFFLRRMLLPTKSRQRPWKSEPGLSALLEARADNLPAGPESLTKILLRPDWKPKRVWGMEGPVGNWERLPP